ncbi:MAG: hypothetical protein AAF682_21685 [Planctomycetota bacterium]
MTRLALTLAFAVAPPALVALSACAQRPEQPEFVVTRSPGRDPWFRREAWREEELPPEETPVIIPVEERATTPRGGLFSIPGPRPQGEWKTVRLLPGASADTITLSRGERDYQVIDSLVQASARTAFIAYQGGGPYRGTQFVNSIVRVEPNTLPDDRSFWALRGYDMIDTTLDRVEITGFGKVTPKHDEGHAVYFNIQGGFRLLDSNVHHNGGQALQLVNRPYESSLPPGAAQGRIEVARSWIHENGFNPDRGGFQISIFGTGQDVLLDSVEILAGHDHTRYEKGMTGGALLIEAEYPRDDKHNCWWAPRQIPDDFVMPFTQGTVELRDVRIDHKAPNRPLVQISGCEELVVSGSEFRGGKINLDDPTKPGRPCGRIVWEGNHGDAEVYLRGELLGPASEDFVALNGRLQ